MTSGSPNTLSSLVEGAGQTNQRFEDFDVQRAPTLITMPLLTNPATVSTTPATMKVLLLALSASSVAAFAPNTFGIRRTFRFVAFAA